MIGTSLGRFLRNESGDATTTLFAALNILLLAFFILLNTISVFDERKVRLGFGSLTGTFGILGGGVSPFSSTGKDVKLPSPPMAKISDDYTNFLIDNLEKFIHQINLSKDFGIILGRGGMTILLSDRILFDPDSAELKPEILPALEKVADLLYKMRGKIRIEGHTDSTPVTSGKFKSNWELSVARASAAARFLIDFGSISPRSISVAGYADQKPIVTEKKSEQRHLNRRIQIILETLEQG